MDGAGRRPLRREHLDPNGREYDADRHLVNLYEPITLGWHWPLFDSLTAVGFFAPADSCNPEQVAVV